MTLPDYVYGVRDASGLGVRDVMFTLRGVTDGDVPGEVEGLLFGAWSAVPDEVLLAFGSWSGTLERQGVAQEVWSG